MKARNGLLTVAVLGLGLVAAQSWGWSPGNHGWMAQNDRSMGSGMMGHGMGSMQRHREVMRQGVPEPYASLPAPAGDPEQVAQGRKLYQTHCVACHGPQGRGDGPAAKGLTPAPANLARLTAMPMGQRPGLLAFAIGEGGAAYGTAMPAYKDVLTTEQRQALVAFLREGL